MSDEYDEGYKAYQAALNSGPEAKTNMPADPPQPDRGVVPSELPEAIPVEEQPGNPGYKTTDDNPDAPDNTPAGPKYDENPGHPDPKPEDDGNAGTKDGGEVPDGTKFEEVPLVDPDNPDAPIEPDRDEDGNTIPQKSQLLKVKVGGEEREIPVEEAIKDYELRQYSHERLAQANQLVKQAEEQYKPQIEFTNNFFQNWQPEGASAEQTATSQAKMIADLFEGALDKTAAFNALVERAAALKEVPGALAALGVTEQHSAEYERKLKLQREFEQQQAARQEAVATPTTETNPDRDTWGQDQWATWLRDIHTDSGTTEDLREYAQKVLRSGREAGISDPYRAYERYRRSEAEQKAADVQRAVAAAKSVTQQQKVAAVAGAASGARSAPVNKAPVSHEDAADLAWRKVYQNA